MGGQIQCLARQVNGGILVGLRGEGLFGLEHKLIRLNPDGTVDTSFVVPCNEFIEDVIVRPDEKILVAGRFTTIKFGARNGLAQLTSDGALDTAFIPNLQGFSVGYDDRPNEAGGEGTRYCPPYVLRLALQADKKVILFGAFEHQFFNQTRNHLARINENGSIDESFTGSLNRGAGAIVVPNESIHGHYVMPQWHAAGLALQADGKVLIGGIFTSVGTGRLTGEEPNDDYPDGTDKDLIARLLNGAAQRSLLVENTKVTWTFGGTAPELLNATFERSSDGGANWVALGSGSRIGTTSNWEITGLNLVGAGQMRARGQTHRGGLLEQVQSYISVGSPVVTTPTAANIGTATARLGGTIVTDNGAAITERGVVFSSTATNADPVIDGFGVEKWTSSDTTSPFFVDVSGLVNPVLYSFKAYAKNSVGTSYSPVATFSTIGPMPPTVANPTVTILQATSVELGGEVISAGTHPITERGVVYALTSVNPSPQPNHGNATKVIYSGSANPFTVPVTVAGGASYSFRAYAISAQGYGSSSVGTFTAPTAIPTVTTQAATGIFNYGAVLRGTVNANGTADVRALFESGRAGHGYEYGAQEATPFQVSGSSPTAVSFNFNFTTPHTTFIYRLITRDSGNNVLAVGQEFTFTTPNSVPVATGGSATVSEDTDSGVLLEATDADNEPVTVTVVTPPAHGTLAPWYSTSQGVFMLYTPAANYNGPDSFTYRASDGFGGTSSTVTMNLTVAPVNDPPTINAIADPAAINEDAGQQTVSLSGIGNGGAGEGQTLTVTATSGNPAVIPNPTVTYTSPSATGSLKYTPVPDANGSAVITVTVSDGVDATYQTFTVTVNSVNDVPGFTLPGTAGETWTARASGTRNWRSIASSANGMKLAAVGPNDQIYTSTDAGVTWTARESNRSWFSIASSADGTMLAAVVYGGQIYTSTNSGVTWTARETNRDWSSIASSADGTMLTAGVQLGQIYTSTNAGVTWTARTGPANRNWMSVASSANGTHLAAVAQGAQIHTSTDSGVTWTARESTRDWTSIASSADGTMLVAGVQDGQIYTSTNAGATWTARESNRLWRRFASSDNGTKLAAVVQGGQIYTSTDAGVTWTARESNRVWYSIACSADGTKLAAGVYGGPIYTSDGAPRLSVAGNSGPNTTAGLATNISAGPANESGQTVSFNLSNPNNALFTAQPAIASDGTLTFTPIGVPGTVTVTVTAQDNGGTANGGVDTSSPQTFTVTVTASAPAVSSPTATNITETSATLGGNVTGDGGSPVTERGVVYALTSVNPNPTIGGTGVPAPLIASGTTGVFFVNVTGLTANTAYTFRAYATNATGTTYTSPASLQSLQLDSVTPETTITSTLPTPTRLRSATITFTGSDNFTPAGSLVFEGRLDGAAFAAVTSPVTLSSLADGTYTYEVRARDAGGNVDDTPASVTWVVDSTLPVVPGDLDLTFGTEGKVTTAVGNSRDRGYSVAVQADGRIVVAGSSNIGSNDDFALVRYTSTGALDTTFNGTGKVTTDFGRNPDIGYSVAVQSDGQILVAGSSGSNLALVRYTSTGALDTSFSGDGKLTMTNAAGYSVAVQSDGKILVAGNDGQDFLVVRYTSTGALDTSFGTTGRVTIDLDGVADFGGGDYGRSIAVQSDGKILVAGYCYNGSNNDFALVRFTSTGALDTSFGGGTGKVITAVGSGNDYGNSMVLQNDGRIVVAGYSSNGSNNDFALVRCTSTGDLDTSFGTGGKVSTAVGSGNDLGQSVAVQSDGKIVVAGYCYNGSNNDFALVRFTSTGALDTSFGGGTGKVITAVGSGNDYGNSMVLQSDGRIVVAGYSTNGSNDDFALVRYESAGSPEIDVQQPAGTSLASGGSRSFGSVNAGSTAALTFTIANLGYADLTLTGTPKVAVSGSSDFSVTAQPTSPVAASGTTTFTVRFAPTSAGSKTATLTIANDDSNEGTYTVIVNGTGVNLPPVVTLLGANALTFEAAASYTDPGATATDAEDGALTPAITTNTVVANVPGTYAVTWRATDSGSLTGSATRVVNVVDTTAPVVAAHGNVTVEATSATGAVVNYAAGSATDAVGVTSLEYSKNSGTTFPLGETTVTITALDAAGHSGTGTFTVTVTPADPVSTEIAGKGSAVPGAGVLDSGIQAGALWTTFGVPSVNEAGQVAFLGGGALRRLVCCPRRRGRGFSWTVRWW